MDGRWIYFFFLKFYEQWLLIFSNGVIIYIFTHNCFLCHTLRCHFSYWNPVTCHMWRWLKYSVLRHQSEFNVKIKRVLTQLSFKINVYLSLFPLHFLQFAFNNVCGEQSFPTIPHSRSKTRKLCRATARQLFSYNIDVTESILSFKSGCF